MVESRTTGVFNAAGPRSPMTMREQLTGIRAAVNPAQDVRFTWVPAEFLVEQKVAPWGDMPTWLPKTDPEYALSNTDTTRAVKAGLTYRSLATSSVDALSWFDAQPEAARTQMMKAGLTPEREGQVLEAWRARSR